MSLGNCGMGWTAGTEGYTDGTPQDVLSLSVHPLGTEGWDVQLGQRPLERDSMGCPLTVCTSLGTEGWDVQLGQRPV